MRAPAVNPRRLLPWVLLAVAFGAWFAFDGGRWLSLDHAKAVRDDVAAAYAARPAAVLAGFGAVYVATTALSLPGATVLTLLAGAVFGVAAGTLLSSFASTAGATLAMLLARHLLRGAVRRRWRARVAEVDAGFAREGAWYLLTLRLVPLFPYFAVNLLMGLTAMPVRTYWWVSQLGMLPATLVVANAGRQLAQLQSLRDVFAPGLLLSLAALGLFPLAARRAVGALRRSKAAR